jgi:hypothetical protein
MLLFLLTSLSLAQETTSTDSTDDTETSDTETDTDTSSDEASAAEKDTDESSTTSETANKPIEIDVNEADSLDTQLSKAQLKWLRPSRGKLPQNPYQHTDFTAYTLEWGEIQLGLNQNSIGILPRTQIGTQVPLNIIGIYNANIKVNALRAGPFDLAITGNYLTLPSEDISVQYYGVGGYGSLRVLDNWSVHAGGQYANLNITGFPSLKNLNGILVWATGLDEAELNNITDQFEELANYERQQTMLTAKLATDIRLNRRDSFILQGSMVTSQSQDAGLSATLPDGTEITIGSDEISSPLFQSLFVPKEQQTNFSTSLAYQASFKRAYLRLGWGYSTIPYSFLLQTIDFTWRLGGKTKRRANNMQKIWELNKKSLESGGDKK